MSSYSHFTMLDRICLHLFYLGVSVRGQLPNYWTKIHLLSAVKFIAIERTKTLRNRLTIHIGIIVKEQIFWPVCARKIAEDAEGRWYPEQ